MPNDTPKLPSKQVQLADAALDQMYGHYTRDDSPRHEGPRPVVSDLDALKAA